MKKPKKINGVKPTMSRILVEILTAQEQTGTRLTIDDKSDFGAPQAYILAIGPSLNLENCGFKVGDRVLLTGDYTPVPKWNDSHRECGLVEMHSIKAVLEEGD